MIELQEIGGEQSLFHRPSTRLFPARNTLTTPRGLLKTGAEFIRFSDDARLSALCGTYLPCRGSSHNGHQRLSQGIDHEYMAKAIELKFYAAAWQCASAWVLPTLPRRYTARTPLPRGKKDLKEEFSKRVAKLLKAMHP